MTDSVFSSDEALLLDDAFDALRDHFVNREGFLSEYRRIADSSLKLRFLRLSSVYKNLVKDGSFKAPPSALSSSSINYYDVTYKYIALISIVEAVFGKDKWLDFYEWLRKKANFPIEDKVALKNLYDEYNLEYGAIKNAVKFFRTLQVKEQEFIKANLIRFSAEEMKMVEIESTIDDLAKLLYAIRSEFMHNARLIVEFGGIPSITTNRKKTKPFTSTLNLNQLMKVFEVGFIRHFGMQPEREILLF